jgi:hypothetical protein
MTRRQPLRSLTPSELADIVERTVRGESARQIGRAIGRPHTTVLRALRHEDARPLLRDARRRAADRARQARYQERKRATQSPPTTPPADPDEWRISTPGGIRRIFRDPITGVYYRDGITGRVRAKRSDWGGSRVPADFEALPLYGPPDAPREMLGVEPQRVELHPPPGSYEADIELIVRTRDADEVARRTAQGWTVAPTRPA